MHNKTTAELVEIKEALETSLASWYPFQIKDPVQRRSTEAKLAQVKNQLAKRSR